ncbi:hypothetical protein [Streptomyces sp. NPDC059850]|uniref:hypothetical protein n=1 Tax=Streptomyces sp. NPDC059850 TaxID=3346970 RepID=UPI003647F438
MVKSIKAGISAVAMSTALLAGAASAQAETARTTQAAGWEYYNWYLSQNNCLVAGGELSKNDPSIRQYRCDGKEGSFWYLYLYRA